VELSDNYFDSLESYRLLVDSVKDYAIFMLNPKGFIATWNIGAQRIKGYAAEEIIGQHFSRFYTEQDNTLHLPEQELVLAAKDGKWEGEGWRVRKDGSRFWAYVVITSLWREQKLVGFAKVTRDMTRQKQNQDALERAWDDCERRIEQRTLELQQSEDLLRSAFEQAAVAISYTLRDGLLRQVNQRFCALLGYSKAELASMRFNDITYPEDRAATRENVNRLLAGEIDSFSMEKRYVRRNGSVVWAHVTCSAAKDTRSGQIKNFVTFVEDISWRKQAEKALRDSEVMFRTMANAMPQIVWSTRPDGYHDYFNERWYEFTGLPEGSSDGCFEWFDVFHPDDRRDSSEKWRRSLETGERYEVEYRLRHWSGQFRWILGRAVPVRDEKGEIVRWMGTCTDIHEKKMTVQELYRSEQKFRLLYENAPIGIAHFDLEGRCTYGNHKFAEIIGYTQDEVVGIDFLDLAPPEERAAATPKQAGRLLTEDIDILREGRILHKDGATSWVRVTARMLKDEAGKPQYGIAIFEDIDERKRAEAALRDSEERFRATFENAPLGIGKINLDGMFTSANSKLLDMLGYTLREFIRLSIADITSPADREQTASNLEELVSGRASSSVSERRLIRKDGSFIWVTVTTSFRKADGEPQYVISIFEDITERKRAEEELRRALEHSYHLANHDALTGLANRVSFNNRLRDALSYARRDGHLVAIHLLDLDRFKAINDTLGHHAGDLLLKEIARRLKALTRSTDIVARLGGDEFVIIQTHLSTASAAAVLAEKVVKELGRSLVLDGQEINTGCSIGIAVFPGDAETPQQLIKLADLALYEVKMSGRYHFQFYRPKMGAALKETQLQEQELRRALSEEQFCLHYQPQFDLKSNRVSGIEALVRWRHPERGLLSASEFIGDAEKANLTPLIGEWSLSTACAQYKQWMKDGRQMNETQGVHAGVAVPLVLNVSLRQLRDPRFLQILKKALAENGLPPSMLQLDVSEVALWDPAFSTSLLTALKNFGVRLALDDFGAELAALSSLHRFPVDVVKTSRTLVKELPRGKQEAAVLSAIIGIAHEMNIGVHASGIETADELDAVREHGCDAVQGFLLAPPSRGCEVAPLLSARLRCH